MTSDAWKKQKGVSAEEGIIATAYERKHGEWRSGLFHSTHINKFKQRYPELSMALSAVDRKLQSFQSPPSDGSCVSLQSVLWSLFLPDCHGGWCSKDRRGKNVVRFQTEQKFVFDYVVIFGASFWSDTWQARTTEESIRAPHQS